MPDIPFYYTTKLFITIISVLIIVINLLILYSCGGNTSVVQNGAQNGNQVINSKNKTVSQDPLPPAKGTRTQGSFSIKVIERTSRYIVVAPSDEGSGTGTIYYRQTKNGLALTNWSTNTKFEADWGTEVSVQAQKAGDDDFANSSIAGIRTTTLKHEQTTPIELSATLNANGKYQISISGGDGDGKLVCYINNSSTVEQVQSILDHGPGFAYIIGGTVDETNNILAGNTSILISDYTVVYAFRFGDDYHEDSAPTKAITLADLAQKGSITND